MASNILNEVAEILGYSKGQPAQPAADVDIDVARLIESYVSHGLSDLDEVLLEGMKAWTWNDVTDVASLGVLPAKVIEGFSRSWLAGGAAGFRGAWRSLSESVEVPTGTTRSGFVVAASLTPDPTAMRQAIVLASMLLGEASGKTKKKAAARSEVAKALLATGDKQAKVKKAKEDARSYMSPHEPQTDRPAKKKELTTAPAFRDAKDIEKERSGMLKKVEKLAKKMITVAKKHHQAPEEMFPNLWRDVQRERVRYS